MLSLDPHSLSRSLFKQLRELAFDHKLRYTEASEQKLICLLFKLLVNEQDEYQTLLFKGSPPLYSSDRWKLSEALGAIEGAEYTAAARGKPCGHIFRENEATYSCRTCTKDDTCVLCAKCFESSDHEGHQVVVSLSAGTNGCCDCGDAEAWSRPINCTIHAPQDEAETIPEENDNADAASPLPTDFQRSIRVVISSVLDFICDVFSCSPEFSRRVRTVTSVSQDEAMGRLTGQRYAVEDREEQCKEYALVLWNDEKHTFDEVQHQVNRACSQRSEFGEGKARDVDRYGRTIVEYSSNLPDLLRKASILEQIKVTVTVRSSRDTFREQMCGTIVDWLNDIAGCPVGEDHNILINTICEELLGPWRIGSRAFNLSIGKNGLPDEAKSDDRLQQRAEQNIRARMLIARDMARQAQDGDAPTRADGFPQFVFARRRRRRNDQDEDEDEDEPNGSEDDDDDDQHDDEMDLDEVDEVDSDDQQEPNTNQRIGLEAPGGLEDMLAAQGMALTSQAPTSQEETPQESDEEVAEMTPQNNTDELLARNPSTLVHSKPSQSPAPAHWLMGMRRDSKAKHAISVEEDLNRRVRIDFLVLYDMRMWKTLRNDLRSLYITSVVRIPRFKRLLGLRFAAVYNWLSQLYLVADREPDLSIINLSLQMLTTPSITAEVVERGSFLTQLLAILYTYFTKRSVGRPEEVDPSARVAFEAGVMTNRRIHHFFNDMKYLLESPHVQQQIRVRHEYLLQFIDYITLYQGICSSVRAIGEHVEYESEAFISAAGVTRDVTRITRHFFEAFDCTGSKDPENLRRAMRVVARACIISSLGFEGKRSRQIEEIRPIRFKAQDWFPLEAPWKRDEDVEPQLREVVAYSVESEPMSFYHPLQHALSWLIEGSKSMTLEDMRDLLSFSVDQLFSDQDPSSIPQDLLGLGPIHHILALFDIPLRVCAWTAQIKAGMWIRNGMTLRHQLSTYRTMGQRDATVQRDYFLLQVAFAICPKDHFLPSVIDRYGMDEWMRCKFDIKPLWDDHQMIDVCEEFIHLLIIVLSDRALLYPSEDDHSAEEFIAKREIAHALCFKPMSHSDLSDRLTVRVTDMEDFDDILAKVAKYRPPDGLHDSGIFELKEGNYSLIDPYNPYFNKNQREEAENAWRQRKAKATGQSVEEVVFEPNLRPIESGIFKNLGVFTQSMVFAQVIFSSLRLTLVPSIGELPVTRFEAFLPTVLHLLLLAMAEDTHQEGSIRPTSSLLDAMTFIGLDWSGDGGDTIFTQLLKLLNHDHYANSKAKLRLIFKRFQAKRPVAFERAMNQAPPEYRDIQLGPEKSDTLEDMAAKKRQAQERQAKVMASFKKQQSDFLKTQNIDWGDDEWDELENEMDVSGSGATRNTWNFPRDTCIVCQEETNDQRLYGALAYIDQSSIFRETNLADKDHVKEVDATPVNLDHSAENMRPFGMAGKNVGQVTKTDADGKPVSIERRGLGKGWNPTCTKKLPLTSGCGHLMHFACFESFNAATERRQNYQIARLHPERPGQNEFVCPLCKALGNSFLPIIWKPKELVDFHTVKPGSFDQWITAQAPFLVSRAFDRTTYEMSYSSYMNGAFVQTYASKLSAPAQPKPSYAESRPLSSSTRSFISRSRPTMPLREPHSLLSRSQDGQDGQTTELLKAYRRLQQTMQAMGLKSIFVFSGIPPMETIPNYMNHINADALADALGGSITNVEIAQRGVDSSNAPTFIENVPEQTLTHLRVFSETCSSYIAVYGMHQSQDLPDISLLIRRQIVQLFGARDESMQTAENLGGREAMSSARYVAPLLYHDSFMFFTSCRVFMNPFSHLDTQHVMRLCYLAEMVKIVIAFVRDSQGHMFGAQHLSSDVEKDPQLEATQKQSESFSSFVQDIMLQLDQSRSRHSISDEDGPLSTRNPNDRYFIDKALRIAMMTYLLPFARKCLLLVHIRGGIDFSNAVPETSSSPELYRLLRLLGLPRPDDLIETFLNPSQTSRTLHNHLHHWLDHLTSHQIRGHDWPWYRAKLNSAIETTAPGNHAVRRFSNPDRGAGTAEGQGYVLADRSHWMRISLPHPGIYELVGLPHKHDTLNAEIVSRRCPTTGRQLQDPCLCLFCGAIFCSQASCCQVETPRGSGKTVGGCFQHQQVCGGHLGMFLNIPKCAVLVMNGDHGSWFAAPYLDAYGETDWGLKRKGILYLNRRRYDRLFRDVWLGHGIPSCVARRLEGDVNNGGWETL